MNGRDKRWRVKSRQTATGTDRKRQGDKDLLKCQSLTAAIDSSTCRAEQRIQRCAPENKCTGCDHFVSMV